MGNAGKGERVNGRWANAGMGEEEIGRTMSPGTLIHRNVAHSPLCPFALSPIPPFRPFTFLS